MEIKIATLMGMDVSAVLQTLDQQLEPAAYSGVPGAVDLTDIKPAWLVETLNRVFGLAGYGWWFIYDPADLTVVETTDSKGRTVYQASLAQLAFYYRLIINDQVEVAGPILANGYSDNYDRGYAVRGALTNAQGAAASKLGWQLSVYQNKRSHRDMRAPADVVIPFGKHKGKKISEAPVDYVRWLAEETNNADLKAAAQAFLDSDGESPPPPASAKTASTPAAPAAAASGNGNGNGHSDMELTFGKHKGKQLSAVYAEDASYVEWLASSAKSDVLKAAATALIAAQSAPAPASVPQVAPAQAPKANGGMNLEQALKLALPFGTRTNPGLKDKSLAEAERIEPAFVEFLASPKGAKYQELHKAAKIVVSQRVPVMQAA